MYSWFRMFLIAAPLAVMAAGPKKKPIIVMPSKKAPAPIIPQGMPIMPPPVQKGPDFIHLMPVVDHQVVVVGKEAPPPVVEQIMLPPPPSPVIQEINVPAPSAYVPPTLVHLSPPVKNSPAIIHALPPSQSGVPSILPTKASRIGSPSWNPVAVVAGPTPGQFVRVGRLPSKQGPYIPPSLSMNVRPVRKGEM